MEPIKNKVGVIVGRFQSPFIHGGYKDLFEEVSKKCDSLMVFIGVSPLDGKSERHPLSFEYRRKALEDYLLSNFSEQDLFIVRSIPDLFNVYAWSKLLDTLIIQGFVENNLYDYYKNSEVTLYGSRDSFSYNGTFKKVILEPIQAISSTQIRNKIEQKSTKDFAEGIIYSLNNQFPRVIATVDIAITDDLEQKVLLCRKPNQDKWRFVGGFADPHSKSFEEDAIRETKEETNLTIYKDSLHYIGNFNIDDPRYRGTKDQIRTIFYLAYVTGFEEEKAQDDIEELRWFPIFDLPEIEELHVPLLKAFEKELILGKE